jgi:predicted alpha/beta superfamily hydrolase
LPKHNFIFMYHFYRPLTALFIFFAFTCQAQVQVIFKLDTNALKAGNKYYLAGNINGWNPADTAFSFVNNQLHVTANPDDIIEYKITRGTWNAVESGSGGADIANRIVKAVNDTSITIRVVGWKDDFKAVEKKHTASANVHILDTAFYIPQLQRHRTVRIYLPPDYKSGKKKYPVLYMSDGQNCFDEYTSSYGEWHVDETLDRFYDSCKKSMIIIAVDHGDTHRVQEYDPYDFERFGKGEGKAYSIFLAETLKPYIDSSFRTKSDKKNTHIAGSSMGGVISMWTVIAYPDVFGNAGVFSPAFWTATEMYKDAQQKLMLLQDHSFFFYAGGSESKTMVEDTKKMYRELTPYKKLRSQLYIDEMAQHNEAAWSKWFPVYLTWILN